MSVDATIKWYLWSGSEWTDISGYVLSRHTKTVKWGMRTAEYTDRMAATGEMGLLLNNNSGVFDPDNASALTGWGKNAIIKMVITYDGVSWVRFRGYVDAIALSDPNQYDMTAMVTVLDWMNYAYKYPLTTPAIQVVETGDAGIETIVSSIGRTPQATNYSTGVNTFEALFDTVDDKTTAAEEINKIVLSELGYFYVRHDRVNGETLVFENASDRNALRTVAQVPKLLADCTALLDESGNALLDEEGNALIANETQDAYINGTGLDYSRAYGQDIINRVIISAYPKEIDTTAAVLYKLDSAIKIAPGETKVIKSGYQNATTKDSCAVITTEMIQPVATTDYTMFTGKTGGGTNLTANLTVTATYGTGEVSLSLTNGSAYTGWITKLQCRGIGVYQNDTLKEIVEDTTSQTNYALSELQIEQKYQRDTAEGLQLARRILEAEKNPRTILKSVTCLANTSSFHMQAFLSIDVGDLVHVTESYNDVEGYYYVQGVTANIVQNRFIQFTWVLSEAFPNSAELTAVTVENAVADTSFINFGTIRGFNDADEFTFLFDIYAISGSGIISNGPVVDVNNNYGGNIVRRTSFISCDYSESGFYYSYDDAVLPSNEWIRVGAVYKKKSQELTMYLGGTVYATTLLISGSGSIVEHSNNLKLFSQGVVAGSGGFAGSLKNIRLYDVALTPAEIAEDYVGGTVTRGICFDGPYIRTSDATYFTDHDLLSTDRLIDGVHGYIGTPVIASGGTITTRI